jgi:hypothetical protein
MNALVGRPAGITAMSLFFIFGTTMSGLAALSLIPGSVLEPIWRLNPRGHEGLRSLGSLGIVLMATVSLACLTAAAGLWRGRRWGQRTAAIILSVNAIADAVNGIIAGDRRTLIGLPIAAAMLWYLYTRKVRGFFAANGE